MHIGERIRLRRKELGLTQVDLADYFKISNVSVSEWERGLGKPDQDRLPALARKLKTSVNYLLTGKDEAGMTQGGGIEEDQEDDFAMLRHLDVKASAGSGNLIFYETDKAKLAFRKDFLRSEGVREKDAVVIYAAGQSMEPTIPDGAVLLVDTGRIEMRSNDVFVVRLDGEILVKRLRKEIGGGVLIVSDNPDKNKYPDILVSPDKEDHLSIIGRVFWMGARL